MSLRPSATVIYSSRRSWPRASGFFSPTLLATRRPATPSNLHPVIRELQYMLRGFIDENDAHEADGETSDQPLRFEIFSGIRASAPLQTASMNSRASILMRAAAHGCSRYGKKSMRCDASSKAGSRVLAGSSRRKVARAPARGSAIRQIRNSACRDKPRAGRKRSRCR